MKRKAAAMTAGLLALVLLFGGYALLRRSNEKKAEQEAAESAAPLLNLTAEDLSKCSFDIEGKSQTFLHDGEAWSLASDETFPVNGEALNETLSCFSPLTPVRTLTGIGSLNDYGLDSPVNIFTLTQTDGSEKTVRIGDVNEGTGDVYILLDEDESCVYTVSPSISSAVKKTLYDYALSEELPSFSASDLQKVLVVRDGAKTLYEKSGDGWIKADESTETAKESTDEERKEEKAGEAKESDQGAEDEATRAEEASDEKAGKEDALGSMIEKLAGLSYSGYLEHACTEDEKYGLSEKNQLTIYYSEGEETLEVDGESKAQTAEEAGENSEADTKTGSLTFLIGNLTENGEYCVRQIDSAQVHTISPESLAIFEKEAEGEE